jgi:hypothetical protein
MTITPISKDKRFIISGGTILIVLALCAVGRQPNEAVLSWLGVVLTGFMAQSQWGQTTRAKAAPPPVAP